MFIGQGKRYRLFSLFGFPVLAQSSVLVLFVIYLLLGVGHGAAAAIQALLFAVVAFASILVHELGHALMIRRLGYGGSVITLHGLGGQTEWRGTPTRRDRIWIALAGPGAGLALGGAVLILFLIIGFPSELLVRTLVVAVLWVNLGWSLVNLLPVWPLDGGQVLRTAMSGSRRSSHEVVQRSLKISMITAGAIVALSIALRFLFAAALFGLILWSNYNEWKRLQGPPSSFYGYE